MVLYKTSDHDRYKTSDHDRTINTFSLQNMARNDPQLHLDKCDTPQFLSSLNEITQNNNYCSLVSCTEHLYTRT